MADIKNWTALSEPDPEYTELMEQMGGAPDLGMFPDIASMRSFLSEAKKNMSNQMGSAIEGVKEEDHQVSMRDGQKIICRTYSPEKEISGGSPLVVIFHGGGWCIGDLSGEELLCRLAVSKLGMVAVNVDYRLGPEHKFPTAVYDCHDATKWAAENASKLGADPSKGFIVGGTSAGGNLTAIVSHLCRDEKLQPPLTGQHLMIPALCAKEAVPERFRADYRSYEQNANAPNVILSEKSMDLFTSSYGAERKSELFSPLIWSTGHKGLPPAYFQVCGLDPLRDEALIYERLLREEDGVKTKINVYPGLPHGFWGVFPKLKASAKFVDESVKGLHWLLEQK